MSKLRITQIALFIIMVLLAPSVLFDHHVSSGDISYQLDWQWGNAQATDNGWQVTNDIGYTVNVAAGYVVSYNASLNDCPHSHGLLDGILQTLTPATVKAGHGADDDEATINHSVVESLVDPQAYALGTVTVSEPSYCEGFYLIGVAHEQATQLPDDLNLLGTSLYIVGTYQAPNSAEIVPFQLESQLAWGTISGLVALDGNSDVYAEISDETIQIIIQRDLGSMFDTVDFSTMDDTNLARTILQNLAEHTRIIAAGGIVQTLN